MATHSSVLAWRIPGTGEPGGLLSMGLHRVGHDWRDLAAAADQASNSWVYCTWELSRENNLMNYLISSGCCSKIPWTRQLKQPGRGSGEGSLPGLQMAALCCVLTWQREHVGLLPSHKDSSSSVGGSTFMTSSQPNHPLCTTNTIISAVMVSPNFAS